MMKELNKYQSLKTNYFQLLSQSHRIKGHMRALVGGLAAITEHELLINGEVGLGVHASSLEMALEETSRINKLSDLKERLDQVRQIWVKYPKEKALFSVSNPILEQPIREIGKWKHNGLNAVSLFSGAMGLDLGVMAAGFDVRLANDLDVWSQKTVNSNLPELPFINRDIDTVTTKEILRMASIPTGDLDLLVGGPPCQPFSPAGKRAGLSDPRASPLKYFIKAVREMRPRAFIMEEVPGLLSSRLKHFPISERGRRAPLPEEKSGSAFKVILEMLRSTGYNLTFGRLNAADFGSPQVRERIIFIGLREKIPTLPPPSYSNKGILGTLPWNSFWEAAVDVGQDDGNYPSLSDKTKMYMNYIPPGGNWRELPDELVKEAMGGAFFAGGGKMGFYRRLSWDDPSPTVVTSPMQKGTMFIHPLLNRPISIKEYARVQGFPDDWKIIGSLSDRYRLIGNAVPVHLSYSVAKHVKMLLENGEGTTVGGIYGYESHENAEKVYMKDTEFENNTELNEQEQKVIAYLLENYVGFTKERSEKLSNFFTGIRNFMTVTPQELSEFNYPGTHTKPLTKDEIQKIMSVRGKGLLDIQKTGQENILSLVTRRFIIKQVENARDISLEKLTPNPFLIRSLGLDTPDKVLRFNVYAYVTRSIVTSFGNDLETLLAGSSDNTEKIRRNYWDLVKTEKRGLKHYIQVKSGPNDMNKGAVKELASEIEKAEKLGDKGYLGIGYGTKEKVSITLNHLKTYVENWEEKVLIGKELWDFVSGDSSIYGVVLDTLKGHALEILGRQDILDELEIAITKVKDEFLQKYGDGKEGVDNYIADVY